MENKVGLHNKIEIKNWDGPGYQALVAFGDWLVALLNWEERFDLSGMGLVERHTQTDEVFVLVKGHCLLFIVEDGRVEAIDMEAGVLYNIPCAVWHNLLCSRDASLIIVESRDTSVENSDYRPLTEPEKNKLASTYPDWLSKSQKMGL